ncbi:MAG: energy-coupling factor transporter ATPase [Bacillota bacterium]|nr:energy-coupling factor transporter ATPase [Bacillota bacterium]MDI7249859.1 energy-coupling factor transporter ATPase [Bacillota bacterium]
MPICVEGLTHIYLPGTPMEVVALEDVSLEVRDGEFLAIIGPTGSGKSTLIQHFNGLLRPTRGRVVVGDLDLSDRRVNLRWVRQQVGLVFQYPEQQLFEETVLADVAFGPRNLGYPPEEVDRRVEQALEMVGLGREMLERSPFELSGGETRRVAIAGVLAMGPRVLVLDEPTAGLDPRGRQEILSRIRALHADYGLTVVLVTHQMEDVARLAQRVAVLDRGRLLMVGSPREVFAQAEMLDRVGLGTPVVTRVMRLLQERGWQVRTDVLTEEEAEAELVRVFGENGRPLRDARAPGGTRADGGPASGGTRVPGGGCPPGGGDGP